MYTGTKGSGQSISNVGTMRAYTDALQADSAFRMARRVEAHRLDGMAVYSTVLWHLRRETALSYLAHEVCSCHGLMAYVPLYLSQHAATYFLISHTYSHTHTHTHTVSSFVSIFRLTLAYLGGGHRSH